MLVTGKVMDICKPNIWETEAGELQAGDRTRPYGKSLSLKQKNKSTQLKNKILQRDMVAHAFNPSTWEAEAGRFLSVRPAWSTE